jgi:hypothetical protein
MMSLVFLLAFVGAGTTTAHAQCVAAKAGNNTIYGPCGTGGALVEAPSTAFIDAFAFSSTGDICNRINAVLISSSYPPQGAVVDARGIGAGTTQFCGSNPWSGVTAPSVVLLPSGTIIMSTGWVLPDRTRLIGEGNNPSSNGTVIDACLSGVSMCGGNFTGTMIEMCTSACNGVSVEYLQLDGNNLQINGIVNSNAGPGSYVDHVNLHLIEDVALTVSGTNAEGSGPYSNMACSMGSSYSSSTACVVLDSSFTRGVHGLTCTGVGNGPAAAVRVDSSGNTIENVHFEGTLDGIRIGFSPTSSSTGSPEQGDLIMNINGGDGGPSSGPIVNMVEIYNSSNAVSDLTVLGIGSTTGVTNNLLDDETNTAIPSSTNAYTGQYILGQQISSDAYYRFATTPVVPSSNPPYPVPTWVTESLTAVPSGTCPAGAIFSNSNALTATSVGTLFVCTGSNWVKKN